MHAIRMDLYWIFELHSTKFSTWPWPHRREYFSIPVYMYMCIYRFLINFLLCLTLKPGGWWYTVTIKLVIHNMHRQAFVGSFWTSIPSCTVLPYLPIFNGQWFTDSRWPTHQSWCQNRIFRIKIYAENCVHQAHWLPLRHACNNKDEQRQRLACAYTCWSQCVIRLANFPLKLTIWL